MADEENSPTATPPEKKEEEPADPVATIMETQTGDSENEDPSKEESIPETKSEEAKSEEAKSEDAKDEKAETEDGMIEEPKIEEPKSNDAQSEEEKTEEDKSEEIKSEEAKSEEAKSEAVESEAVESEAVESKEAKAEEAKGDTTPAEEPMDVVMETEVPAEEEAEKEETTEVAAAREDTPLEETAEEETAVDETVKEDTPKKATTEKETEDSISEVSKPKNPAEDGNSQEASSGQEVDEEGSKADEQSVGDAQNEESERTDDAMDTEDQNTNQTEATEEQSGSSKAELPYSTRGRSTGNETGSGGENGWDRGALETLEEIGRAKEHTAPAPLGTSFLEALSEEERRTRTRFLPEVDGMHILRKGEIKDDLALARSLVSASGVTSLKKSKGKRSRSEDDSMDIEDEEGASPSEDDRSSDNARGTAVIEFRARDLIVPSNAFCAPNVTKASKEDGSEDRDDHANIISGSKGLLQSPSTVDSVTAFNPPRPPESIGAKKKHRMLRWERRPEDVEVDLNNYRKTVQRTRQELHSAESEYNRLETIDAHLRWHYLNHLNLMNEEFLRLNQEFSSVQQECVKAADLLTSRTRSRGAGKGSYVMRDVLTVLKTRGTDAKDKDVAMKVDASRVSLGTSGNAGVGGLPSLAFGDWRRSTTISPMSPASSWLLVGEKVKTPYGDGVVTGIHPAMDFRAFSHPDKPNEKGGDDEKSSDSASGKVSDVSKGSKRKKDGTKLEPKGQNKAQSASILPTRVSVKLEYGIGHFALDAVTPADNPAVLSDGKLAKRWKGMVDSALSVGGCLDLQGMSTMVGKVAKEKPESDSSDMEDSAQGRTNDSPDDSEMAVSKDSGSLGPFEERVLPFGSSMLPTSSGRGATLQNLSIGDIEDRLNTALFAGRGVLGKTSYQGLTEDFRKWEDDESEYLTLQASVLQLRNALVRQKRIRMLNERTSAATTDRYHRAEELVSEMRADLKSLKQRLEQELQELGIDEATAEQILASFYRYHAEDDNEEDDDVMEYSPKRPRSALEEDGGTDAHYDEDVDREPLGAGTDDLTGDDIESERPAKKIRPNQ